MPIRGVREPTSDRIDDLFEFLGIAKLTSQVSWRKASNASVKKALRDLAICATTSRTARSVSRSTRGT